MLLRQLERDELPVCRKRARQPDCRIPAEGANLDDPLRAHRAHEKVEKLSLRGGHRDLGKAVLDRVSEREAERLVLLPHEEARVEGVAGRPDVGGSGRAVGWEGHDEGWKALTRLGGEVTLRGGSPCKLLLSFGSQCLGFYTQPLERIRKPSACCEAGRARGCSKNHDRTKLEMTLNAY